MVARCCFSIPVILPPLWDGSHYSPREVDGSVLSIPLMILLKYGAGDFIEEKAFAGTPNVVQTYTADDKEKKKYIRRFSNSNEIPQNWQVCISPNGMHVAVLLSHSLFCYSNSAGITGESKAQVVDIVGEDSHGGRILKWSADAQNILVHTSCTSDKDSGGRLFIFSKFCALLTMVELTLEQGKISDEDGICIDFVPMSEEGLQSVHFVYMSGRVMTYRLSVTDNDDNPSVKWTRTNNQNVLTGNSSVQAMYYLQSSKTLLLLSSSPAHHQKGLQRISILLLSFSPPSPPSSDEKHGHAWKLLSTDHTNILMPQTDPDSRGIYGGSGGGSGRGPNPSDQEDITAYLSRQDQSTSKGWLGQVGSLLSSSFSSIGLGTRQEGSKRVVLYPGVQVAASPDER